MTIYGLVKIGNHVTIHSGSSNIVGSDQSVAIFVGPAGELSLKSGCGISNTHIACFSSIVIGENALIGGGTRIYDSDFHATSPGDRARNMVGACAPIVIENNVFIGAHCIILKGVTIGANSVVGAGSLVTRDVPCNEVWGGVPARKIRSLL